MKLISMTMALETLYGSFLIPLLLPLFITLISLSLYLSIFDSYFEDTLPIICLSTGGLVFARPSFWLVLESGILDYSDILDSSQSSGANEYGDSYYLSSPVPTASVDYSSLLVLPLSFVPATSSFSL